MPKIIKPSFIIESNIDGEQILREIELYARNCYKSEEKIGDFEQTKSFVSKLMHTLKHRGIADHHVITVRLIVDRGCCYDDETEVLTRKGWKKFSNLGMRDELACMSDFGELLWEHPSEIQSYDYDGDMLRFETTSIDLLVTPNHNMWTFDYDKRSKESRIWKFLPAENLKNNRYGFVKNVKVWNGVRTNFVIPKHPTKHIQFPEISLTENQSDALFELLGFWITDGSYNKGVKGGSSIIISQSKPSRCERIEYLCSILPFRWRRDDKNNQYHIDNLRLMNFVSGLFGINAKTFTARVPQVIKESSVEQIQRFIDGVVGGDGNVHKKNNHVVVYTSSYLFAGDLQDLFLKLGLSANIRTITPRNRKEICGAGVKSHNVSYVVSVHGKKRSEITILDKGCAYQFGNVIPYSGKIWCATVPYHRLYIRRNGKTVWCGNSHEVVRHRIAAYLQESTRYCDYSKAGEIQVIDISEHLTEEQLVEWWEAMVDAERHYNNLRAKGARPECARSVLPNSLKTEIIMTLNLTSWRNFFIQRAANKGAHGQMREVAVPLLLEFQKRIPVIFDDIVPVPIKKSV